MTAPSTLPSSPTVPISWGELVDKITILEIKVGKLDGAALDNVRRELVLLTAAAKDHFGSGELLRLKMDLRSVNNALWEIEDSLRAREAARQFDAGFITLARSVYTQNDRRARIKREINRLLSSDLVEEKLYAKY
jgi:hypothetical protein